MRLTVASFKGGVAKSTTAVHLAAFLQEKGPTLLIDGDPNRSVLAWAERGKNSLPFQVVDISEASRTRVGQFRNVVVDTEARPGEADLKVLAESCDLLVVPSTPDIMSLHALVLTVAKLQEIGAKNYKVLLSVIPPKPSREGEEARAYLKVHRTPVFRGGIRRLAAFPKAALAGVLVHQVADPRGHLGWGDYQAVGKELVR